MNSRVQAPAHAQGSATHPSGSPGWPLRAYFSLLVGLFLLAAAAATVYVFVQSDRDARRESERNSRHVARTTAAEVAKAVTQVQGSVEQLAGTPGISAAGDQPGGCQLAFSGPGGLEAGHIDILQADGAVICSSRQAPGEERPAGYRGEEWVRRARAGKLFEAPVVDSAAGGQVALSAAPAEGAIIAGFLALEPAGKALADLFDGGRRVELLIASRDGREVIARSIAPRRWIGRSLAETPFGKAPGAVERPDVDGVKRLYANAVVPGVGWRVYVGEDKDAALAAASRLRSRQLAIILVGLALVLVATLAVYRRVALPVTRLGAAVRATSELAQPAPVAVSGPAEVGALGEDVNGLIASVNRELGERRRAEESARASEHNYRLLFGHSPLPMWVHDVETLEMVEVNDAAVEHYGYTRDEFLALKTTDLEVSPSRHRRKDGSEIEVRAVGHDVVLGDRPARVVLAEDVGERERLEQQLRQAQRMEAIGRLAGGIAHDFNNLLTAVIGYSELLLAHTPPADPRHGEAEEIKKAGERAVALTRQLLTLGRGDALEPVVLDLNEIVTSIEPMLRRLIRADVAIETVLAADQARIRGNRGQIEQVLVNLAVNAGDAMPHGGRLTIATATTELDHDDFRLYPSAKGAPGRYVMLEVSDTGEGMDEETLSHVFEPFFTTKGAGAGTGLGLATVYGVVGQSGGSIWADSEPGRGTTFKVYLPAVLSAVAPEPAAAPVALPTASGVRVLLVEDDPAVRAVVRRMLESHGFAILEAEEGDEALALGEAQDPGSLELLITDTVIPGPGGVELSNQLRRWHPQLKTLVMSGYSDAVPADEVTLGESTEFIAKPFQAVDLTAKLVKLLHRAAP